MRIFVTGATGFIGSSFVRLGLDKGLNFSAATRNAPKETFTIQKNVNWVIAPLDNIPFSSFEGCDTLVHFAAHGVRPSEENWRECFFWNVSASLELWIRAAEAGVRRFLICGSGGEYGISGEHHSYLSTSTPLLPSSPYGASKAAATMAAVGFSIERKVELAVFRPFQVYGEGEADGRFWPSLRRAALEGSDFPMTEGNQIRDFVPVEQVASRFIDALTRPDLLPGMPIIENIGTGNSRSLLEFAEAEWKRLNAAGKLLPGVLPQRSGEIMRYVPKI